MGVSPPVPYEPFTEHCFLGQASGWWGLWVLGGSSCLPGYVPGSAMLTAGADVPTGLPPET